MKKTLYRHLGVTVGCAFVVVAMAYVFNLLLFSYTPRLQSLISPSEALFLEGLVVLVLGVLILLGTPHGRVVGGRRQQLLGSGGLTTDVGSERNRTKNMRLLGFALVVASIIMFILYSLSIY